MQKVHFLMRARYGGRTALRVRHLRSGGVRFSMLLLWARVCGLLAQAPGSSRCTYMRGVAWAD